MDASHGSSKEIAVPASIFAALRRELAKEAGPLPTIHALHAAGYSAGAAAATAFSGDAPDELASVPQNAFWARLTDFFKGRGWGTFTHAADHPAVGLLTSGDWIEAEEGERDIPEEHASCSFTTGYLSGLLTELAGGPVAVLEVECRARGNERCAFAFGSEAAVHELYGQLLEGSGLQGALERL